jgi:hypothetical protein
MFNKYTVCDGPAGMPTSAEGLVQIAPDDWQLYCRHSDNSPDYVGEEDIIYRFSSTFLAKPDEFRVLLHSSEDGREHVFQKVRVAKEDDSAQLLREIIYFRSDYPFHGASRHKETQTGLAVGNEFPRRGE